VSGWRHLTVRGSLDYLLYTDQDEDYLRERLEEFLTDRFLDAFCDCNGEPKFDTDENHDRWTKSRYFPCCRVQVGGARAEVLRETWDSDE